MYLGAVAAGASDSQSMGVLVYDSNGQWAESLLWHMWKTIVLVLQAVGAWVLDMVPSLTWTVEMFGDAYDFIRAHPHPFHLISWALFFGPIIILVPSLVILEILILFLFNLSFMSHGLFAGSVEERFHVLREYFMDTRESLFATVEHWTAVLNTWTMKYPPLLLLRLIAGMLGLFVFIGLWSGW